MSHTENLRDRRLPLRDAGAIPALGFGTLIPDTAETRSATGIALEAGFRHFDCSERYRNEEQVGEAIQAAIQDGWMNRSDLFITTQTMEQQQSAGAGPVCDRVQL